MKQKKYKLIKIFIICGILLLVVYIFNYIKENSKTFTMKPSPKFFNVIKDIKKEYPYVKSTSIKGDSPNGVDIKVYINEDKKKEDAEIKAINNRILSYAKSYDFIEYLKNEKRLSYVIYENFSLHIEFNYKKYYFTSSISDYYYNKSDDKEIWKPRN